MSGRMRAIGRRTGNPYDVEFKEFGGATAIAARECCRLVTAQAEFGTVSFRNLQKMGFRIAYTKAMWEKKEGS